MGLLDRVSLLVRSNLDSLLDKAEDPEKAIKTLLSDLRTQQIEVRTQVAAAIADEKRVATRYEEAQRNADDWQRKAELALDKGDESLAKQALTRQTTAATVAEGLKKEWDNAKSMAEALRDGLHQLDAKIDEVQAKEELLITRSRVAKSQEKVGKIIGGINNAGAGGQFDRLERKIEEQEARAQAYTDLNNDGLDQKFAALESESEVDRKLREMKERRAAAALPAGSSES